MYHRNILIEQADPQLWAAIQAENRRQEEHIELIASENYASPAVMAAQGSQLTNKYAEGYPGKRYYGGCENVDVAEQLALSRVKQLFGADAANVQAHSGAQANEAVFLAFLTPGDTIMGMSLAEGGHLTHGMALNMSGKWFNVVSYGLNDKEEIDYEAMERKALESRPKLIIAGASAYALRIDFERFARVASLSKDLGAYLCHKSTVVGVTPVDLRLLKPSGLAKGFFSKAEPGQREPAGCMHPPIVGEFLHDRVQEHP